jgi:hypothetical protein
MAWLYSIDDGSRGGLKVLEESVPTRACTTDDYYTKNCNRHREASRIRRRLLDNGGSSLDRISIQELVPGDAGIRSRHSID